MFVKRHSASLKSRSYEKMRDENCSTHKKPRPMSAGGTTRAKVVSSKPPDPEPEPISNKAQSVDPLSYIFDSRACKPSRESLSDSTESVEVASDGVPGNGFEIESSDDAEIESNKENQPQCVRDRKFSVDEHFLEEGRYHQVKEVAHDLGSLRPLSVPEDLYKAVQQRTPNVIRKRLNSVTVTDSSPSDNLNTRDYIFAQYGKEVKRVVVPQLPLALDKLLDKVLVMFGETLTADMVPLKALYIQDAQTKIFYQLDDQNDVVRGSHIKIHEEFVIKNVDRGSSQSLEDLNNSSNSSLSSGGFVIPTAVSVPIKPGKRPGRSRLSLVEERLSYITHEMHTIHKSDTGSTVSSQTEFPEATSHPPQPHLHAIIRTLYKNLQDTKSELIHLKRREMESRAEMDNMLKTTSEEITRHIEAALPQGIRRQRLEADKIEAEYRQISEATYSNIKDLERTVEVLKTDVVKRKVKLDPAQLETMEKELQTYTEHVFSMNSTFGNLKASLKKVITEELEIIVNEEQFLEDEEPMLEDVTVKCEELARVMETLKKVAIMQKQNGIDPPSIYTVSECDVMEERKNVLDAIAGLVPNHDERILSIQATEEYRLAQRKFVKSDSDCVAEEINFKAQNLRKTNAFEELERKRDEALKAMYTAQPPPHKFGRKTSQPQFTYSSTARRGSISKCKSMSNIDNKEDDSRNYRFSDSDDEFPAHSSYDNSVSGANIKRSRSFTKEKEKQHSSEDEKTKKKTVFGFFSKKSKSKTDESKQKESNNVDHGGSSNGDVFVVDTARDNPPSPALIPRSYTEGSSSRKNTHKSKSKADRTASVNFDDKSVKIKKGKSR